MAKRGKTSSVEVEEVALTHEQAVIVRSAARRIKNRERAIIEGERAYLLNGLDLKEVKAAVGHGYFGPWCVRELGYSKRTAEKMMRAAELFGERLKSEPGSFLAPPAKVAYALSAPSCPQEVRDEFVPRILAGEVVKPRDIGLALKAAKPATYTDTVPSEPTVSESTSVEDPAYVDDAKRAAVTEVVTMIKSALAYDGICIAALIRHGLGEMLMDQIDAACGKLPAPKYEHVEPEEMGEWTQHAEEASGAEMADVQASADTTFVPNRRVRRFLAKMERKGADIGRQMPLLSPAKTRH